MIISACQGNNTLVEDYFEKLKQHSNADGSVILDQAFQGLPLANTEQHIKEHFLIKMQFKSYRPAVAGDDVMMAQSSIKKMAPASDAASIEEKVYILTKWYL